MMESLFPSPPLCDPNWYSAFTSQDLFAPQQNDGMLYNFDLLSNKKLPDKAEIEDEGRHHLLQPVVEGREQNAFCVTEDILGLPGHPLQQQSHHLLPTPQSPILLTCFIFQQSIVLNLTLFLVCLSILE